MVWRMVHPIHSQFFICYVYVIIDIILCVLLLLHRHVLWSFRWNMPFGQRRCGSNSTWEKSPELSKNLSTPSQTTWLGCGHTCASIRVCIIFFRKLEFMQHPELIATVFLYRVFELVAAINKGAIFSLLPFGAVFLALTILNLEYVSANFCRQTNSI